MLRPVRRPLLSRALPSALLALSTPGLAPESFLLLPDLPAAALVRLGLAGGDGVDTGADDLHRQGDDADGGAGDTA